MKRLVLLFLPLLTMSVMAQRGGFLDRSEILLAGGGTFYVGDLNNQTLFSLPQAGASLGIRSRLDNRWSLRLQATYGSLACSNDYIPRRNLSFRSKLFEGMAVVEFDFRPYGPGATESHWTPYLFGGLGVFHFNPQASVINSDGTQQWIDLQPLCTEGQGTSLYPDRHVYPLTQLCLPFGLGIRTRLGKHVSLTAEYGFRKTWTDYIDDVSTTYVGRELLEAEVENGTLAADMADRSYEVSFDYVNATGIKRGDDSLKDWYTYFNVSIGINLELLFGWMRSNRCRT